MSQPQAPVPPQRSAFSPQAQHSPSPTMPQQPAFNQAKQQPMRASPNPASPFPQSQMAASPGAATSPGASTPTTGLPSPSLPARQSYPASYPQPLPNGRNTPTAAPHYLPPRPSLPATHPAHQANHSAPVNSNTVNSNTANNINTANTINTVETSASPGAVTTPSAILPPSLPTTPSAVQPSYSSSHFAPAPSPAPASISTPAPAVQTPNTMGPPPTNSFEAASRHQPMASKPAPAKQFAYDMDDTLAGTGINLDEEEQFMNDYETRTGFGAFPPGGRGSFYGAGPANQPAEHVQNKTQQELVAEAADRAWNEAAHRLAVSRLHDWKEEGFVSPAMLHHRMDHIAKTNNLGLNLDRKPQKDHMPLGKFPHPANVDTAPTVKVRVDKAPSGTVVRTSVDSIIPKEAYLIDQIALLSLATKEYVGELLADADSVAKLRQQTAHGVIPPEWADVAVSPPVTHVDSAGSPGTNPLKRPASNMSNGLPTPVSVASPTNPLVEAITGAGKKARDAEEARLLKRQKRMEAAADKDKKEEGSTSRAGSVAPGTPGSVAADAEVKPPTKKESKKAAKLAEASSSTVNATLSQFMGGTKKKKYSWLSGGASGASTPLRAGGMGGTPAASGRAAAKGPLTQASAHHLGQLREDSAKGKNIQLRDWVCVLEQRRSELKALQEAYMRLDRSDAGDKVAKAALPAPTDKANAEQTA